MSEKNAQPSARDLALEEREEMLTEFAAADAAIKAELERRIEDCRERGDDELATVLESVADRLMTHLGGTREAYGELLRLEPAGNTAPRAEIYIAWLLVSVQSLKRRADGIQKHFAGLREALAEVTDSDPGILKSLNLVLKRSDASQRELAGVERGLTKLRERLALALANGKREMKR